MSKIGFILMLSQDHDLFRNIYFHYIISNTIFKRNVRGPKIGPSLESILHLFVRPLHISNSALKYLLFCSICFIAYTCVRISSIFAWVSSTANLFPEDSQSDFAVFQFTELVTYWYVPVPTSEINLFHKDLGVTQSLHMAMYKVPSRQWDCGRWKSDSLWNSSIVGYQWTVNCLLGCEL